MKILYFGTYNSEWGRSRSYIRGLIENGVEILECHDDSPSFRKYWKLWVKHRKFKNYDFLMIGYPGHSVVWFAKLLSKKPVIFDAGWTMEEGVITSRRQHKSWSIRGMYIKFVDWMAVKCADKVLVESEEQRRYFEKKFGKNEKYYAAYSGADDSVFYMDQACKKKSKFTVLFRGKFLPEAGVTYVLDAAKLLENKDIDFIIIGNGWLEREIRIKIKDLKLANLDLISENLSYEELRNKMSECHVSLGQLEEHERLKRTIPHKCYESLALGLPYITARTKPVSEILEDGKESLFVNPADPQDLADKILMLKNSPDLAKKIGENGYKLYKQKFTPKILASQILKIIQDK
jgi:glycosyltransferase involved in cell wall biosynthesis